MAGERDENELSIPDVLGILPLRGTVMLPHAVIPLAVGRPGSVRLVQEALQGSRILGAVMPGEPAAEGPSALADLIAGSLPTLPTTLRQELLETISVAERLQRLVAALTKEVEVLELGSKIQSEAQSEMSKTQREYYLREQMKAIQKELGDADDRTQEIDALREKIEAAGMTEEAKKEALRELDRLAKM